MIPTPGIEPGPAGWEPAILSSRPPRFWYDTNDFIKINIEWNVPNLDILAEYWKKHFSVFIKRLQILRVAGSKIQDNNEM